MNTQFTVMTIIRISYTW